MTTKSWLKSSDCWVLGTGLYTYLHKLGIHCWASPPPRGEDTLLGSLEDLRRASSFGCQKKKVARDVTVTALVNQCLSRGTGNEGQKCSSLLKDIITEWYPRWGWGSLPQDEAQPQHTRAFRADTAGTKLKCTQGSHGKIYSFHVEW